MDKREYKVGREITVQYSKSHTDNNILSYQFSSLYLPEEMLRIDKILSSQLQGIILQQNWDSVHSESERKKGRKEKEGGREGRADGLNNIVYKITIQIWV